MSDEELMAAVCAGDQEAYQILVRRHLRAINHYALRLLGNTGDAEDIAQETFLRLWLNAETWQPRKARLTTWLHRISHNLCIDHLRKSGRMETGADLELEDKPCLSTQGSLSDETGIDSELELLQRALGKLPESQRSAIMLCHHSGFSNREAADIMGITVRALESLLARARRQLRQVLTNVDNQQMAS